MTDLYVSRSDCAEVCGHTVDVFNKFLLVAGPIQSGRTESIRSRRSNWRERGHLLADAIVFCRQHVRSFGSKQEEALRALARPSARDAE